MNAPLRRALVVSVIVCAACGRRTAEDTPAAKAAAAAPSQSSGAASGDATSAPSYFTVPPEQLAHLEIAPVKRVDFATVLKTTGTVDWDNDHTTQAITQVNGPISRILVDTGAKVAAGDPLLYVASPDVADSGVTEQPQITPVLRGCIKTRASGFTEAHGLFGRHARL